MSTMKTLRLASGAPVLAVAVALGATLLPAAPSSAGSSGEVTCRIEASRHGGAVSLEVLIRAPSSATGGYAFTVTKSGGGGSANIDQSGEFTGSGAWSQIADVELGGDGSYVARLKVTSGGRIIECSERIKGSL